MNGHDKLVRFFRTSPDLVGSGGLLLVLLEPVLLNRSGLSGRGLALNLNLLGLVVLQFVGDVGLLGGWGRLGNGKLLSLSLSLARPGRGRLVGTQLTEVQVLDGVRYMRSI